MKVQNDCVVTLEHEIKSSKDELIESSFGTGKPLKGIVGRGSLPPGFDQQIQGLEAGAEKQFEIPREMFVQDGTMKKTDFPGGTELKRGSQFEADLPGGGGKIQILVAEVTGDLLKVKYVLPLALKAPLKVKCKILDVRTATPGELKAGAPAP